MKERIAIIAPEVFPVPPIKGGAVENHIYIPSKLTKDINYCIFSVHDEGLPLKNDDGNIRHFRYKKSFIDRILLLTYKLPFKRSDSFLFWRFYAHWCAKLCRKNKSKIIRVYDRWQFIPIIRKLNPEARIFFHVNQLSALNMNKKQSVLLRDSIDVFVTVSRFMVKKIVERVEVDEKKVYLVKGGVQGNRFLAVSDEEKKNLRKKFGFNDEKIIIYAGRLVENKGAHVLIDAFNLVNADNVKLLVVGGNTYSDQTKTEYIKRLKQLASFKNNVVFYGFLNQEDLLDLYRISDIFAFPSQVEEALGLSLIEAMSCGLAPIVSNRGGISDLIKDQENGFLIDEYSNSKAWTESLDKLLNDDNLRRNFGLKSRAKVEKSYSWEIEASELKEIYRSIG